MTKGHSFVLARALPSDLAEMVETEYRAFPEEFLHDVFMGPDTPEGHQGLVEGYKKSMQTDFSDYWIKITDTKSGKIVAASNWKIYQSAIPEHKVKVTLEWLKDDPEKMKRAMAVWDGLVETRKRLMTEPYLQLYICYTDPAYQRQGAGSMMLKWGCELADLLALPAWVEASVEGNRLYKAFGFETVEMTKTGELEGSTMKRPATARIASKQA